MIKQYKNNDFRFVKIGWHRKNPIECGWQTTSNYSWDDPRLLKHIAKGLNYGICGGFGGLLVIDCDNSIIEKMVEDNYPPTLKIHKHYYFTAKNGKSLKLLKGRETYADIQYKGKQAVAEGSIHPSGRRYEMKVNLPIAEIDFKDVERVFAEFIEKPISSGNGFYVEGKINGKAKPTPMSMAIIKLLSVTDVMKYYGFQTDRKYVECRLHNSKGKHSFCWDDTKGVWYCQGCHRGGNVITLIRYCERLL